MTNKIIFILDDDIDYLETVEILLSQKYTVKKFSDPIELLRQVDLGEVPDLFMTDITMSEMDGLTLLKELNRRNLNIPTIMVSGNATKEYAIEALRLGAYDLLEKPCNVNLIRHTVSKALVFAAMNRLNEDLLMSMTQMVASMKDLLQSYEGRYMDAEKTLFQNGLSKEEDGTRVESEAKRSRFIKSLDGTLDKLVEKRNKLKNLTHR